MYAYDQEELMRTSDDVLSDIHSVPSNIIKNMPLRTKVDRLYTIKKQLTSKDGKYHDFVTITMYGSGSSGAFIRNAVTGAYTNHLVGSKEDYLYFSVSMCNGMDKANGPVHLYYDSPIQYEKHQYVILDQKMKDDWFNRVNAISKR
jgi:hypothetical protein